MTGCRRKQRQLSIPSLEYELALGIRCLCHLFRNLEQHQGILLVSSPLFRIAWRLWNWHLLVASADTTGRGYGPPPLVAKVLPVTQPKAFLLHRPENRWDGHLGLMKTPWVTHEESSESHGSQIHEIYTYYIYILYKSYINHIHVVKPTIPHLQISPKSPYNEWDFIPKC